MNGTELLLELLKACDRDPQVVVKNDGRIGGAVKDPIGPLAAPYAWLTSYKVPIVEVQACDMPAKMAACFCASQSPSKCKVMIPYHATITDSALWDVWHECGHAADWIMMQGGEPVRYGWHLSVKHQVQLQMHQETIIKWCPHPNTAYKIQPIELWAETVAACVMDRDRVPPQLFAAIRFDLEALKIPVGPTTRKEGSFKYELQVGKEWGTNAMCFATEKEAHDAGRSHMDRWFSVTAVRVIPSEDPVNAVYNYTTGQAELVA